MFTRPLSALLVVVGALLSQCIATQVPSASVVTTKAPVQSDTVTVITGQAESLSPDPGKPYREMVIQPIGTEPTNYSASVVCKRDSLGVVLLHMQVNPLQHSIEKLALAFGTSSPRQTAKQLGAGTGHYDAKSQRYYFSVYYQVVTKLPDNQLFYGDLYPVHGWVSTRTNTLGLQL